MRQRLSLGMFGLIVCSLSVAEARDSVDVSSTPHTAPLSAKVLCKDGSYFRGEPIEVVPRDHLTLQLVDGKLMRIDWNKILTVEGLPAPQQNPRTPSSSATSRKTAEDDEERGRQGANRTPVAPVSPSPEPTTPALPPLLKTVTMPTSAGVAPIALRFTGMKKGAFVEYVARSMEVNMDGMTWPIGLSSSGIAQEWRPVCALPCALGADPETTYRIRGPEIVTSSAFRLPTRGKAYEVEISPGYRSTRTAAWVLLGVGGGLAALGSLVISIMSNEPTKTGGDIPATAAGGVLLGSGVVLMVTSLPLFGKSMTTLEFYRE